MRYEDIEIGDIVDAYIEGNQIKRVMIISKISDTKKVFGLNTKYEHVIINPETEIEYVIANINTL